MVYNHPDQQADVPFGRLGKAVAWAYAAVFTVCWLLGMGIIVVLSLLLDGVDRLRGGGE